MKQNSETSELAQGADGEAGGVERSAETKPEKEASESPRLTGLMALVCERKNLNAAWRKVVKNKGSAGADGMTVEELPTYLREHGTRLREQLLADSYRPQPIRQVTIPKPDGGERVLGIPTVVDRFVQQAILQVLQPIFDPTFSPYSFGFRPGRSAHDAIACAKQFVQEGRAWVVDLDLSKFFDRVNHDILMGRLAKRIDDKPLLRLIRRYLVAGMLANGVVMTREEGTPQGGPLSPLLANVLLDEVDKELAQRGHTFVRFADDLNVYVGSKRAGERVMEALRGKYAKLKLQINEEKSAVAPVGDRKFLGFTLRVYKGQARTMIADKSVAKFKMKVRLLTSRNSGRSMGHITQRLNLYLRGWYGYFGRVDWQNTVQDLEKWTRRRLRLVQLKLWKHPRGTYKGLVRLGVDPRRAREVAAHAGRWWWLSGHHTNGALTNKYFDGLGLYCFTKQQQAAHSLNRPVRTRTPGGVAGDGR